MLPNLPPTPDTHSRRNGAPAPHSPTAQVTPAPTWSSFTPSCPLFANSGPSSRKPPQQSTGTKLKTGLKDSPPPSTPKPRRRAQVTPLGKKRAPSPPESPRREQMPKAPDLQGTSSRQLLHGPDRQPPARFSRFTFLLGLRNCPHSMRTRRMASWPGDAGVSARVRSSRPC